MTSSRQIGRAGGAFSRMVLSTVALSDAERRSLREITRVAARKAEIPADHAATLIAQGLADRRLGDLVATARGFCVAQEGGASPDVAAQALIRAT